MAIIKLSGIERRKLTLFLICLSIAAIAWLFFSLSNRYVYEINTKIHYQNFPQNKAFHPLQPDSLKMQVEGSGWQLLFSKVRLGIPSITLDIGSLNKINYIDLARHQVEINRQLPSGQHIVSLSPDTLYFDFSTRALKRVPVILAYNFQFKKQYNISGPIRYTPDYITVTGPAEHLQKIRFWRTDSLKLKNVAQSISKEVTLKSSSEANVSIYPSSVKVDVPVDEFSEKSVEVPIRVLNNKRYDIKLLPQKVTITFLIPLSRYADTDKESFKAVVDLKKWSEGHYSQLPIELTSLPKFAKILRIEPQTVDFILQ